MWEPYQRERRLFTPWCERLNINSAIEHYETRRRMYDDVGDIIANSLTLEEYARISGKSNLEVKSEYIILLRPFPTSVQGCIRYLESYSRLLGEMAACYDGSPMFESKRDQRKLLVLRYFSTRDGTTSVGMSPDLNLRLTNASERLRRYYKQGLLSRKPVKTGKRGRQTMVYVLTDAGRRRLAFLEKNVKFRKAETDQSKKYRSNQLNIEKRLSDLRLRARSSHVRAQ